MTEAEWLSATDPTPMLELLKGRASERKMRLFACAACHLNAAHVAMPGFTEAIGYVEQFADGHISHPVVDAKLKVALPRAGQKFNQVQESARNVIFLAPKGYRRVDLAVCTAVQFMTPKTEVTLGNLVDLFHDIFGNPFRPVTFDPRWRSETVVALATAIYAGRAFDRMFILADALDEAGCDHADMLAHCRGDGPHTRGCWVVDLVLGKH